MVPRNSKPGSDDALIDALLGLAGGAVNDDGGPGVATGTTRDTASRILRPRAGSSCPPSIANLNDDRITLRPAGARCMATITAR